LTSLIKVVLALERQIIPPNPHFSTPNPKSKPSFEGSRDQIVNDLVPFEEGCLRVPTEPTPWPQGRRLRASVNSFGIGGSNAHVSKV
jgi:acyl transferase domain-containing protein